ncbi:DUF222 domain-containing protein [Nocardioides panacihumi]|uniref:DUF222 domain-containing protein n=1 Tax=Nocardioides panacihumi TaxID=400774 RepID=UPI0031D774B9
MHRFLGRLHEVLDGVLDGGEVDRLWALSPEQLGECLREAYAAVARLEQLTLALVAQADSSDLAAYDGETSLVAWLCDRTRIAPGVAKRQIGLARGLEEHPLTRTALANGAFPAASATVILAALDALPEEVDGGVRAQAEEYLAGQAHTHDTHTLRRLADHLEEVIDPDGADARLADQLARAEARAARTTLVNLTHDEVTATTTGSFRIPLLDGVRLQRMLEALLNPGRPDPIPTDDPATGAQLSAEERRGHALIELLNRIPTGRLPQTGGCQPTVVVTMELQTLLGDLRAAHLDTGQAISPGQARRLAARHGLIPAVLGTHSEVLDLGRKARLHNAKQRLAMLITQHGTCAVQTCDRPAATAQAAHLIAWQHGGPTDLTHGALLCSRHHTLADHPDYQIEHLRPGRIHIHRRQ